jgi:hypothetical protein
MANLYRVQVPYETEFKQPLLLSRGERLHFERRATQWEGWLWCTTPDGKSGWVPEAWIDVEGDTCVMNQDYDATELTVAVGEELKAILTESGWLLATSASGQTGWVPLECVEAF